VWLTPEQLILNPRHPLRAIANCLINDVSVRVRFVGEDRGCIQSGIRIDLTGVVVGNWQIGRQQRSNFQAFDARERCDTAGDATWCE